MPPKSRRSALAAILAAACLPANAQLAARKAEDWVKTLEGPERIAGQKIDVVLARLSLRPGMIVADIGAGSGLFSRPLAQAVSPGGKVYAVDIQQDLLNYIDQRSKQGNIHNIQTVLGEFTDPKIPSHDVDLVFINDVLHHIENRAAYLKSLGQYMKPGGRAAIIEMDPNDPNTPHRNQPELLVSRDQIGQWMSAAGFHLVNEYPDVFPGTKLFLIYGR